MHLKKNTRLAGLGDAVTGLSDRSGGKILSRLQEHIAQFEESVERHLADPSTRDFFKSQVGGIRKAVDKLDQGSLYVTH